jgi:hypothetical protein
MPRIVPPDPFGGFLAGRAARQDEEYAGTRNALARMEMENAPAEMQRRNKLGDLQVEGAQQQLGADKAKIAAAQLQQAMDSGNPRAFVLQQIPLLASKLRENGIDLSSMDDQSAADLVGNLARKYAGEAGIAPAGPDVRTQLELAKLQQGQSQFDSRLGMDRERLAFDRERFAADQNKPAGQFRPLSPEEIQKANLPAGTSAQIGPDGKIDVLSKRDNTGVLSQKDATTAKMKLTTVKLARKQLADIRNAFTKGTEGVNAFGPGQGMLPTQAGKKFDAAVDRMRSTLTALTRVPGVGAMSDYETKLDQAKFPNRSAYESVTSEQIQGIEDMLALIENGYTGLLSGGAQEQSAQSPQAPSQSPQQQAPPAALEYLRANPQFKGAFYQKYGYLPDGI